VKNFIGILYFDQEKYDEAIFYFHDSLIYEPKNIQYQINLAIAYDRQGDLVKSRETYLSILSHDGKNLTALTNLGIQEAKNGHYTIALNYFNKAKLNKPKDVNTYINIGNVYIKQQLFFEALKIFKEGFDLENENMTILKHLMNIYAKLEKWEDLIITCKRILIFDKTNTRALGLLVKAGKEKNKFKLTEKLLSAIEKKIDNYNKPKDEVVNEMIKNIKKKLAEKMKNLSHVKNTFDTKNDRNKSEISIDFSPKRMPKDKDDDNYEDKDPYEYFHILKNEPENKNALFNLGMIFYKRKDYSQSEDFFQRIIKMDKFYKQIEVYEKLGDIYFKKNRDWDKAKDYYIKANNENIPHLNVKAGRCFEKLEDFDKALKYYNKSIETDQGYLWGLFHLGSLQCRSEQQINGLKFLKKAYEMDKNNTDILVKYTHELIKTKEEEKLETAFVILKAAQQQNMDNVDLLITLSRYYEIKNNVIEAVNLLENANQQSEFYNNPHKLYFLGLIYEKNKSYTKAIQIYKNILALDKDHIQSMCRIGTLLSNAKEYKRAMKYFTYALKINPNLSYPYYGIGKIYYTLNELEEASTNFILALKYDQDNYKYLLII
jgi:tetratricopeptide (TPR) repeat protein